MGMKRAETRNVAKIFSAAMVAGTISKNGRISKSQMSRVNILGKSGLIMLLSIIMFCGCQKENNPGTAQGNTDTTGSPSVMVATAIDGQSTAHVASVKVMIGDIGDEWEVKSAREIGKMLKLALAKQSSETDNITLRAGDDGSLIEADFKNGSFNFNLPATIADKYLTYTEDLFSGFEGLTITPEEVKSTIVYLVALNKNKDIIGYFLLTYESKTEFAEATYMYVKSDVSVKGEGSLTVDYDEDYYEDYTVKFNCSFKKGWNFLYEYQTSKTPGVVSMSNQKPAGVNLKWEYFSFEDDPDSPEDPGEDPGENPGPGNTLTVNATVEGGNSSIKKVKAIIYGEYGDKELANVAYSNNKFNLTLPATVESRYLESIDYELDTEYFIVSDENTKVGGAFFAAFDNYNEIGEFENYAIIKDTDTEGDAVACLYVYVDKNCTIKGEHIENYTQNGVTYKITEKWDASFKKGWNCLYYRLYAKINSNYTQYTETDTYTTTKPSGVTLKWYYEEYEDNYKKVNSTDGKRWLKTCDTVLKKFTFNK